MNYIPISEKGFGFSAALHLQNEAVRKVLGIFCTKLREAKFAFFGGAEYEQHFASIMYLLTFILFEKVEMK